MLNTASCGLLPKISVIESVLKVNGSLCAPFGAHRGVRQGCALCAPPGTPPPEATLVCWRFYKRSIGCRCGFYRYKGGVECGRRVRQRLSVSGTRVSLFSLKVSTSLNAPNTSVGIWEISICQEIIGKMFLKR